METINIETKKIKINMNKKNCTIFLFLFFSITIINAQKSIDELSLKAYTSKDSSTYLFKKIYKKLATKSDTASYLYYKFYKKDVNNQVDSANYLAKKLIPLFQQLDTVDRLRKIHLRLYYQNLNNGNYDLALKEIQSALELAKKLNDTALISLHYSDISILYHDFSYYDKGVYYGKKAFAIMNSKKVKEYKYLMFANNATAINFDDWNKPDSALFYHYKNLKYFKKVKDTIRFPFVYNNIANTNLKIKDFSTAKKYLKRSLAINLIRNKDYNLSSNYNNLARVASEENNILEAKKYFNLARKHAKKSNTIEKIRDVLEHEYFFYKKNKDYEKALQKRDSFYILHDSVFNKERLSKFTTLEVKFETAKKEKEIAQQKEQLLKQELAIKNRNLYAILLASALLILAIIFFAIYKKNQFKRKQLKKEIDLKDALTIIKTQNRLQEQRLRISRDLHDNIGSQLTFIISSIDNLKYISKDANQKLKEKLSTISSFTGDTIHQLRDTIWAMNKSEITIEDLQIRILSFVEKAKSATENIEYNVHQNVKENIYVSSLIGMNIFRVIQEAINNSIKYANATKIDIHIIIKENNLKISVSDNGVGFDITNVILGNGLSNMEKRMSEIDGQVKVLSKLNEGTTIKITYEL